MKITRDMKPPDAQSACRLMNKETENYGVFLDKDNIYREYFIALKQLREVQEYFYKKLGTDTYKKIGEILTSTVIDLGRQDLLSVTPKGAWSLDAPARQRIIDENLDIELTEVLTEYQKYQKISNRLSHLDPQNGYNLVKAPEYRGEVLSEKSGSYNDFSKDFHRMMVTFPLWEPQLTGRYTSKYPAVGNFNKDFTTQLITVPYGFHIYACDSSQIEPRLAYSLIVPDKQIQTLIMLYNDAYFGLLHYSNYLTDDEIRSGTLDFKPFEITEELKEKRQKLKAICNGVMYGKSSNNGNDPMIAKFIKRCGQHQKRLNFLEKVRSRLLSGEEYIHTVFGTPIKLAGTDPSIDRIVNQLAINYIIQGTAADLHRMALFNINEKLHTLGKRSYIIKTVHDSIVIAVADDEKDTLMPYIENCCAYEIENCIPIPSEGEWS